MKKRIILLLPLIMLFIISFYYRPVQAETGDIVLSVNLERLNKEGQKPVLFSHGFHRITHKCKACHDNVFKAKTGVNNINHQAMKEGGSCGKCHNGTIAFSANTDKECERCHNFDGKVPLMKAVAISDKSLNKKMYMELERDKWGMVEWENVVSEGKISPTANIGDEVFEDIIEGKDIKFEVQSEWVADVLFSHKKHTFWLKCENCHNDEVFPKDFNIHVEIKMKDMGEGKWCGKCHNKISFRFANCKGCHNLPKEKSTGKLIKEQERNKNKSQISSRMQDARTKQEVNQDRQRKAWEKWLNIYFEQSKELKIISSKPVSLTNSGTPDGMVYIPEGSFLRGQDWGEQKDNQPSKIIEINSFYIDRLEVTIEKYKAYLKSAKKRVPFFLRDKDLGGANQPMFKIMWQEAFDYCNYYGNRLPTEAEWEKAARGWDNRYFAWGNELPDANDIYRANYDPGRRFEDGFRYTSDVGSFMEGASPYGVLDMAGNLWEWTADRYSSDYYKVDQVKNPKGPESGDKKVIRGGGYNTKVKNLLLTIRLAEKPVSRKNYIGFRCAKSLEE